ncbi:MAG: hypothetical protein JWL77_4678 [Chthonomonadaceae bacterium]|nr:hypothetical protein [Chthonomonadaceae bacterium]
MKAKVTVGTGILVLLAVFATAFAFMNYNRVQVWPLRGMYPLTIVIVASGVLGLVFGVLGTFLVSYFRTHHTDKVVEPGQPAQREHAGRP